MALWLVDTNVILCSLDRGAVHHALARDAGRRLRARGETLCFTLQSLTEFWSVCTRPLAARGGLGLEIQETARRARLISRQLELLPDTEAVKEVWQDLVVAHQVRGVQVYDARLVAAMLAHGATHLLTFNTVDFQRYPQITTVHPQEVVNGTA